MFENINAINKCGFFGRSQPDAKTVIKKLGRKLRRASTEALSKLSDVSIDPFSRQELHIPIDNLTNVDTLIKQASLSRVRTDAVHFLTILDAEMARTTDLVRSGLVSGSGEAFETTLQTINLLFAAKQSIKQEFGIITAIDAKRPAKDTIEPELPKPLQHSTSLELPSGELPSCQIMVLSSAMLFQIKQSLFPAERMIVGAASRTGREIRIEALFDVTGVASSIGVKADPNLLAQALIAMSESGTYFGLWVHSHPGTGRSATHQSSIDTTQHADWLRDYSPDLVSAIMVKDRFLRFWGTAVENGTVEVSIEGSGIETVSKKENVYRLTY